MDGAVDQQGVQDPPGARVNAGFSRRVESPRRIACLDYVGHCPPALHEPGPLELVSRLDDLSLRPGERPPMLVEDLDDSTLTGFPHPPEEQAGDLLGPIEPKLVVRHLDPGEDSLEKVHDRVGEVCFRGIVRAKPTALPTERPPDPHRKVLGDRPEFRTSLRNGLGRGRERQQHKRLIVECGALVDGLAVRVYRATEKPIRAPVAAEKIIEAMIDRRRPGTRPPHCARCRIDVNLTGLDTRAASRLRGAEILPQALPKAPSHMVSAKTPPDRQGLLPKPGLQPLRAIQEAVGRPGLRGVITMGRERFERVERRLQGRYSSKIADKHIAAAHHHGEVADADRDDLDAWSCSNETAFTVPHHHRACDRVASLVQVREAPD